MVGEGASAKLRKLSKKEEGSALMRKLGKLGSITIEPRRSRVGSSHAGDLESPALQSAKGSNRRKLSKFAPTDLDYIKLEPKK